MKRDPGIIYPDRFIDPNQLKGLKILDLCTGGGLFVRQLRRRGVDIIGVDKKLSLFQKLMKKTFRQGNATHLNFLENNSFDVVYVTYGIFCLAYRHEESEQVQLDALKEIQRILKPGGKLRINKCYRPDIQALLDKVSGLAITDADPSNHSMPRWVEITKL